MGENEREKERERERDLKEKETDDKTAQKKEGKLKINLVRFFASVKSTWCYRDPRIRVCTGLSHRIRF